MKAVFVVFVSVIYWSAMNDKPLLKSTDAFYIIHLEAETMVTHCINIEDIHTYIHTYTTHHT